MPVSSFFKGSTLSAESSGKIPVNLHPAWIGAIFGVLVGVGFMMSPVVIALRLGEFGVDFGW